MERYVLGIDQGTTGSKAILFDKKSNIIAQAYSEFQQHYPKPGWVEHDPIEILDVTMSVVKEALAKGNVAMEQVDSIGITNQRETTVFWNKETGEPVGRAIVWQDRRSLGVVEDLLAMDPDVAERTGAPIVPNISASKIKWLLDNDEIIKVGVAEGTLLYGTIDTWLIWKWSKGAAHVSDLSNTSVTALLNANTLEYDERVLEELAIPREILPKLVPSSGIVAYTDEALFGAKIPIAGIAGDQQAATFGQACVREGMAKNTYGTGSFMLMNTGAEYNPPQSGLFSPVLWTIGNDTSFAFEGMADVSGAVVQWLRDELGIIEKTEDVTTLATSVEDNGGVYFVPAFVGLGSPHFDSYARGTIIGLTRGTGKAHIARAALESMAYQVRDALKIMENSAGKKLDILRVDGGGAKNDFLMQFQADILGIPVERPIITETTCLGAAYLAGLATGYWTSLDEIEENWQLDKRFEPQISEEKREELCTMWERAVKHAKGWLKFD
ncbi:glycerol kinase GlpK [Gottschalkiaceae bacterium SANA]|nr:glycerol kinase GlpK [Gottschalkiaceae bacterium SANA]